VLGVSRSGFYDWWRRAPSDRALSDAWLVERIKAIHAANRGVYGARRVHAELRLAEGVRVGRKRVERLMRQAAISGLVAKKRARTTIRVPGVRVADDLVARQFKPAAPNVLWVADITYLRTWEGWVYLAAIQDAFSRRIVGWAMADHMRSSSSSTRCRWPSRVGGPRRDSSTIPIRAASSSHWRSVSRPVTPASRSRWAAAATPMTTPSRRASSRP
jgi:hypothetical protein